MDLNTYGPTDQLPERSFDIVFVFEFEESYRINSIALHAVNFNDALVHFSLILGESALNHVQCVRKIF